MSHSFRKFARFGVASSLCLAVGLVSLPAQAEVILTPVNLDISTTPFTFSFMGGSFTFDTKGGFPDFLNLQTSGGAQVRTVFGQPSTDFTNRGTVTYDANTLGGFAAFPERTNVRFTNGDNFLGLKVTNGGQDFYGFAYTTNTVFNGFGFETSPGVGITATTDFAAAAIPEPSTWAFLILGFGTVGGALRVSRRKPVSRVAYG